MHLVLCNIPSKKIHWCQVKRAWSPFNATSSSKPTMEKDFFKIIYYSQHIMWRCSILLKEQFIEIRFGLELWHYHFIKHFQVVLRYLQILQKPHGAAWSRMEPPCKLQILQEPHADLLIKV